MLELPQKILLKQGEHLIVDKGQIEDAEPLVQFLNNVGGETNFLTFGSNEFPLSVGQERSSISECLLFNQKLMLIGKIHSKIVAQLFLDRSNAPRLTHIGELGVSVSQEYWGNSIGQHLVLNALLWAKNNGITKLQLYVHTDNLSAISLYQKVGFINEGRITRAVRIGQLYFDNYIMGLSI